MTAATSGGASNRGAEDEIENPLVENIRSELQLKRALPVFSFVTKDDLVINEDAPYAVALIKDTLKNFSLAVEEDTESLEEDESNLMKVSKVTDDENDKINAEFSYTYGIDDDEITENVNLGISFGKDSNGKLVIHFEREGGQLLYFKKIVSELKNKFTYATQK